MNGRADPGSVETLTRAVHEQAGRADGTWGCRCGWVQDKPHAEHVADMVAAAIRRQQQDVRYALTDAGHAALTGPSRGDVTATGAYSRAPQALAKTRTTPTPTGDPA